MGTSQTNSRQRQNKVGTAGASGCSLPPSCFAGCPTHSYLWNEWESISLTAIRLVRVDGQSPKHSKTANVWGTRHQKSQLRTDSELAIIRAAKAADSTKASMASQPSAEPHPPPEDFESPKELFEPVKRLNQIEKFWRTRKAILSGAPLQDYSKRTLEAERLMGPWQFNVSQSLICGLPATILQLIFLFKEDSTSKALQDLYLFVMGVSRVQIQLFELLLPRAIPFILLLTAYCVAWSSLRKEDCTREARDRSARSFLYLDGSYGMLLQFALALSAAALQIIQPSVEVLYFVLGVYLIWWASIYLRTIPQRLFESAGYGGKRILQQEDEKVDPAVNVTTPYRSRVAHSPDMRLHSRPPLARYVLSTILVVPLASVAVKSALWYACALIARIFTPGL